MLSEAKHLYNALKCELGFFALLRMTINRRSLKEFLVFSGHFWSFRNDHFYFLGGGVSPLYLCTVNQLLVGGLFV